MKPSQVRVRVLDDHEALRLLLARVEHLARQALGGEPLPEATLRNAGRHLLDRLDVHMRWEDRHLEPALRDAGTWGPERAARLAEEHREQREVLRYELACLADEARSLAQIARNLLDLVRMLETDMVEEERALLDARLLRDPPSTSPRR